MKKSLLKRLGLLTAAVIAVSSLSGCLPKIKLPWSGEKEANTTYTPLEITDESYIGETMSLDDTYFSDPISFSYGAAVLEWDNYEDDYIEYCYIFKPCNGFQEQYLEAIRACGYRFRDAQGDSDTASTMYTFDHERSDTFSYPMPDIDSDDIALFVWYYNDDPDSDFSEILIACPYTTKITDMLQRTTLNVEKYVESENGEADGYPADEYPAEDNSSSGGDFYSSPCVPDIRSFSGGGASIVKIREFSDHTKTAYAMSPNADFEKEYIAILEAHGYKLRDKYHSDDCGDTKYSFDYVGSGHSDTFSYSIPNLDTDNIALYVWFFLNDPSYNIMEVQVIRPNSTRYGDTGEVSSIKFESRPEYKDDGGSSGGSSDGGSSGSIELPNDNRCWACHGSGVCPTCNGKRRYYIAGYGVGKGSYVDCQGCYGNGRCWACGGTGKS